MCLKDFFLSYLVDILGIEVVLWDIDYLIHLTLKITERNDFFQSFGRIKGHLEFAKQDPNINILIGGECDDRWGKTTLLFHAYEFL